MARPSVNTVLFLPGCPAVCALRGVQTPNLLTGMVAAEEQQVPATQMTLDTDWSQKCLLETSALITQNKEQLFP